MTLTLHKKIAIAFFVFSLIPAYFIAQWRYQFNVSAITEELEREHALHVSVDKLLSNCESYEAREGTAYGTNHQICKQGLQAHALSEHALTLLAQEKERSDSQRYRNFTLLVVVINLLAWATYKFGQFLNRQQS
jgi:hypothetical protein